MLPGVNAKKRNELANDRVLVLRRVSYRKHVRTRIYTYSIGADANLTSVLVLDKPSPATSLDTGKSGVHLVLELIQATVGVVDSSSKSTGRRLTTTSALGSQVLPEEGVVQVATAVEVDSRLEGNLGSNIILGLSLLNLLNGSIVVVDVGLVVSLVVDLHDLAGDRGLKGAIVILDGQFQCILSDNASSEVGEIQRTY